MKYKISYQLTFCFTLLLSSTNILHAKAPDVTGARLVCNGDVEIVAQILENIQSGSKEIVYKINLDIDKKRVQSPEGKSFIAYTMDDEEEVESGLWALGIWGPQYVITSRFQDNNIIDTHIGVPFFKSEFDNYRVTCSIVWP